MPKIPGVNHLDAVRALQKAGFRILRQGKHIVLTDGLRIVTIPRHNPTPQTGKQQPLSSTVCHARPPCLVPELLVKKCPVYKRAEARVISKTNQLMKYSGYIGET